MIIFDRKKGTIFDADGTTVIATGIWAGHGKAANDVTREREKGIGPLPAGVYKIYPPRDNAHLGPFVLDLVQIEGESYGRSLFRIHGDIVNGANHQASDGCIIAPRAVREKITHFVDQRIRVV